RPRVAHRTPRESRSRRRGRSGSHQDFKDPRSRQAGVSLELLVVEIGRDAHVRDVAVTPAVAAGAAAPAAGRHDHGGGIVLAFDFDSGLELHGLPSLAGLATPGAVAVATGTEIVVSSSP